MNTITKDDITIEHDNEPRIHDLRLAEALGFAKVTNIRDLISRYLEELEVFGVVVFRAVRKTPKGGRPGKEYYLNEKQALFICTKSEAKNATDITIEMVNIFHAVKAGEVLPEAGEMFPECYHPNDGRKKPDRLGYEEIGGKIVPYDDGEKDPFERFGADGVSRRLNYLKQVRQIFGIKAAQEGWTHIGFPSYQDIIAIDEGDKATDIRCFITDCCVVTGSPDSVSFPPDLYKAYYRWCQETGMRQLSRTMFYRRFSSLADTESFKTAQGPFASFSKGKSNNALYRGIEVREDYLRDDMIYLHPEIGPLNKPSL